MKKLLLMGLAVVAFSNVANAQTSVCFRPYASVKASYSKLNMDGKISDASGVYRTAKKDWVMGGSAAVGVKSCAFRAEFEYNQSATAVDKRAFAYDAGKSKEKYRSYMFNGYFDIPTGTNFHPYVGAGIGIARIRSSLTWWTPFAGDTRKRETNLAWQIAAGLGYNLTRNWTLDIGYRYVDNGHIKWSTADGNLKYDCTAHQILAGVRYTF